MNYLESYIQETILEFESLADCIWKFNLHIADLRKEEMGKLDLYFPNDPKVQMWRWKHESRLLEYVFPKALNYSFAVFVYIEIETRLMRLCNLLQEEFKLPIKATDLRGQGTEKYIEYLNKLIGISNDEIALLDAIRSLGKIRNCIVHTNGFIGESKDNKEIERIIQKELYLKEQDRNNPKRERKLVVIEKMAGEHRLKVDMHYPFLSCAYARDFFIELYELIQKQVHNK
ncbi:MAG: hypothetical protein HZB81_03790 [Deltaproteobacteria bacterium]|nr:hypothetical protein [Deltaproteobacteria bacterium]